MQGTSARVQTQNRVRDDLAGAVVGHVAPARGLDQFNPPGTQKLRRSQDMGFAGAPPQGDNGRVVLDKNQRRLRVRLIEKSADKSVLNL
jgi:hypothetical protein